MNMHALATRKRLSPLPDETREQMKAVLKPFLAAGMHLARLDDGLKANSSCTMRELIREASPLLEAVRFNLATLERTLAKHQKRNPLAQGKRK